MNFAIDFDGTIVTHEYPDIGAPVPFAIESIKRLKQYGTISLWTMRSGSKLQEAVDYCSENGIHFDYVNHNPTQISWTDSPKLYANFYIDDAAVGCPLIETGAGRPFVDWAQVMDVLYRHGVLKEAA